MSIGDYTIWLAMSMVYPMMVDLSRKTVLVVGGGAVAVRKVKGLLAAGAGKVRVVAPETSQDMPEGIERIVRPFETGDLQGVDLVFAATNSPEVNRRVMQDAHQRGLWVNRADGEEGDFAIPALFRKGEVTVAVATGGSPALAMRVRDQLEAALDPVWVILAEVMLALRPAVLQRVKGIEQRKAIFRELASDEAANVVRRGGKDELLRWLKGKFPEMNHA